ncbi:hypothetical protein EON66_04315 [archaeon]|nr:MAG: hypothetical protein EON66_04315 [archaeon]
MQPLAAQPRVDELELAAGRGDAVTCVSLLAHTYSRLLNVNLPMCDACMDKVLKRAQAERKAAHRSREHLTQLLQLMQQAAAEAAQGTTRSVRTGGSGEAGDTRLPTEVSESCAAGSGDHTASQDAGAAAWAAMDSEEQQLLAEIRTLRARQARCQLLTVGDASDGASVGGTSSAPSTPVLPGRARGPSVDSSSSAVHTSASTHASVARHSSITSIDAVHAALHDIQARGWAEYRDVSRTLGALRSRMSVLMDRNLALRDVLSRLRFLTVHSDALFVWYSGPFATINGCRLGRLPAQPVDWSEVNAALGQATLLLTIIAGRVGYRFQRHRVVPMGSFSRVAPASDEKTTYDLYFNNRMFAASRLNTALKVFVNCIAELGEYAQSVDQSFFWPYPITHGMRHAPASRFPSPCVWGCTRAHAHRQLACAARGALHSSRPALQEVNVFTTCR